MLYIVLPMAGRGSRFANAGYSMPKPFIDVCGRPMIEVVVNNLRPRREHKFIFICQNEHIKKYGAEKLLRSITNDPIIVGIDGITDGQLCSAMLARGYLDLSAPVMTANTDQYIDFDVNDYLDYMDARTLDGLIMTMNADDPKWSYVKMDKNNEYVVETAEKQVISNEATVGIYNFATAKDFLEAGDQLIKDDRRVNGEFYICPAYNLMIEKGKKIGIYNIGSEKNGMYGLGIPDDLEFFVETDLAKRML